MSKLGLYVHIPFCVQKCHYCDFPSFANAWDLRKDYLAALFQEMSEQGPFFANYEVDTIYMGGGTPTALNDEELWQICKKVKESFNLAKDVEWSVEGNPGTLSQAKLKALRESGVNRLSLGVQTLKEPLLRKLGRIHSAKEALSALDLAREAGFARVNADLMIGLPEQTLEDVQESVRQIASFVNHLSIYGLKIEEGTLFDQWEQEGSLLLPIEETEEAVDRWLLEYLPQLGFNRYEISNFARHQEECRHNLKYWHYKPYLGLGSGAHSFMRPWRKANFSDLKQYIKAINKELNRFEYEEKLSDSVQKSEFMFLALRTSEGVNREDYFDYFHTSLEADYGSVIEPFLKQELIACHKKGYYLTPKGMKYGNQVFAAFLS